MLRRLRVSLAALALAAVPVLGVLLPATSADAAVPGYPYSGYVSASATTSYTSAGAFWMQPAGTCTSTNTGARFWVGVGGVDGSPGAWVGTDTDCSGGSPVYYGWYTSPGLSDYVTFGRAISAGDAMAALITCASTTCTLTLNDINAGWTVTTTQPLAGTPHSAEAMISLNGDQPLTNFGTVPFSLVTFNGSPASSSSTTRYVITNIANQPLDSIGPLYTYTNPFTGYTTTSFSGTWISAQ